MTGTETEQHCHHFVIRKKRNCRMYVKPGDKYCGEHQPPSKETAEYDESKNEKVRIVCPLDRKHTCYAHNLKKHLKICNARPGDIPSYNKKGINSGKTNNEEDQSDSYKLLSSFPVSEIIETIPKINKVFEDVIDGKISTKFMTHKVVEEEMLKPEYGDKTKKHLKQASSILGLLNEYDLMKPNTCYIEFGAGRGHLSYWLAQATENCDNCSFLLIERSSPKHKRDNKLDKVENKVQRIRVDIADLCLDNLDASTETSYIVGVTKHLCGEATDLALRCLSNVSLHQEKVLGCIMTFCCHHRCRWTPYTGKGFFEDLGLSRNDFDVMCGMSSWATCGTGYSRERNSKMADGNDKETHNLRDKEIGLDREQKEEIGRRCKSILNWGRLHYLEELGFKCALHYYVCAEVSPENVCIVAYKTKNKS